MEKVEIVLVRDRDYTNREAAPDRRFEMACCSAYYAALGPIMNRLMFTDLGCPEALGAFARVKLWMDAYRATEARFVKQDPRFTDPIYEEDLPEGTAAHPDYADIWLLLSLFELGGVSTLSDDVLQPFRDLGVIEGGSQ